MYLFILSILSPFLFSRSYSMTAPTVVTTYGPVSGSVTKLPTNKTVKSYLGIPFAKVQRFEYPVPPDKWTKTLHTNATRRICPQPLVPSTGQIRFLFNEDCLQLDVYIPENTSSNSDLAVMLWIHGGAFQIGTTLTYNGAVLATEGKVVVVVTPYRLGVLGFLSAKSGHLKGNYGMMDQVEAMRWVNRNIARFGGDPDKVTIFGESAGGISVGLMMLSPLTKGFYQNAILQSGTVTSFFSYLEQDEADSVARRFAQLVGCDFSSLKECAKRKTFQKIVDAQTKIYPQEGALSFGPVLDGYFLPESPTKLLQAGKINPGKVMVGVTREDGGVYLWHTPGFTKAVNVSNGISRALFKEQITKRLWIRHQTPRITDLLIYEYTDWSNVSDPSVLREQLIHIYSDSFFKAPAVESAQFFVKNQLPTYFYQLEIAPKFLFRFPIPEYFGVYHFADVVYVFGFPLVEQMQYTTETEIKFSKKCITLWSNFAKTGNPNSPTPLEITWPQYTAEREEYIALAPNFTVRSKMRPQKMELWNAFLPDQLKVEPTTDIPKPATTEAEPDDDKDTLVMILASLTGVFGAVAVILLVVLIVICHKLRHQGKEIEASFTLSI